MPPKAPTEAQIARAEKKAQKAKEKEEALALALAQAPQGTQDLLGLDVASSQDVSPAVASEPGAIPMDTDRPAAAEGDLLGDFGSDPLAIAASLPLPFSPKYAPIPLDTPPPTALIADAGATYDIQNPPPAKVYNASDMETLLQIIHQVSAHPPGTSLPIGLADNIKDTALEPVYAALEPVFVRLLQAEATPKIVVPVLPQPAQSVAVAAHPPSTPLAVDLAPLERQCQAIVSTMNKVAEDACTAAAASTSTANALEAMSQARKDRNPVQPQADVTLHSKIADAIKLEVEALRSALSQDVAGLKAAFEVSQTKPRLAITIPQPPPTHARADDNAITEIARLKAELDLAGSNMVATDKLLSALANGHFVPETTIAGEDGILDRSQSVNFATIGRSIYSNASKIARESEALVAALSKNAPVALQTGEDAWRWSTKTTEALDRLIWSERLQTFSDFKALRSVMLRLNAGQDPIGEAGGGNEHAYAETALSRKAIEIRDGIIDAAGQMAKLKLKVKHFGKKDCAHWH